MLIGQALRLLVAALRATFDVHRFGEPMCALHSEAGYSLIDRSRSAFPITETELKLIAAPAIIGLSRTPKNG
jgi:hypothetical protein